MAGAHEFWLDPAQYQVETNAPIVADFRNGELFDGVALGFFDRSSRRLQIALGEEVREILPRNGDRPAINVQPIGNGLNILLHETASARITYEEWEKFAAFAEHKDFPDIERRHTERGLPKEDFTESYTRHVKALMAVGDGAGSDRQYGLATEFVARTNPYAPDYDQQMTVQLYYQDAPRADAQVEIYEKAGDGSVTVTLTRTDAEGLARFETRAGRTYLVDAVVLREPKNQSAKAVWHSLWAALTFAVPAP